MQKKVTIKYELGHSYDFIYEKSNLYCPVCGEQAIWEEQGNGDYYEGVNYSCVNCDASFTLPSLSKNDTTEGKQLIEQLKL